MIIFTILYIISILISFLTIRKVAEEAIEDTVDLITCILSIFIPIMNIVVAIIIYVNNVPNSGFSKNLVRKVFLIKKKGKTSNDSFKRI